jgi:hypothetical protein
VLKAVGHVRGNREIEDSGESCQKEGEKSSLEGGKHCKDGSVASDSREILHRNPISAADRIYGMEEIAAEFASGLCCNRFPIFSIS